MRELDDLPLLTTVVGSYPPSGLPPRRAIQRAVEAQIAAGVELISDGQVRGDMIGAFASRIPGFRLAHDGIWEVVDALDQPDGPVVAGDFALATTLAAGRAEVKGIVTGPITLALSSRVAPGAPYSGPDDPALILRLSDLIAREVAAVVSAGARVVQVDEPLLGKVLGGSISPELAHDALRTLAAIPRVPALHVCGDIRAVASELLVLPFAVFDIENTHFANLASVDADMLEFSDIIVSVGCVDTQTTEVESARVIRDRIRAALDYLPADRLWISPDCGLRNLDESVSQRKLAEMVAAVHDVRATL